MTGYASEAENESERENDKRPLHSPAGSCGGLLVIIGFFLFEKRIFFGMGPFHNKE